MYERKSDVVVPTTTELYETYLRSFIRETRSIVDNMTPSAVARILSKSIGASSLLSTIRKKHFPALYPAYVMDVIEDLGTRPRKARLSDSDCVFFVKEDGTSNADYTRGLVGFFVIAEVISSTGTDISALLPKTVESVLRMISTLDVNSYKLQCSRHTYIESLSKELMEIVTVLLPKNSELLEEAARVNVSASPAKSSKVTPLLFMGVMFALSSMLTVGAMASNPEDESSDQVSILANTNGFSAPVKNIAGVVAGAAAGPVASMLKNGALRLAGGATRLVKPSTQIKNAKEGTFLGAFGELVSDGKGLQSNIDQFDENILKNVGNSVSRLQEGIRDLTGVDIEFSLEPLGHNMYQIEATKLLALIQVEAENRFDQLNNLQQFDESSIKGGLKRQLINFMRGIDPRNKVFVEDGNDFAFIVESEGKTLESVNGFLDNVTDVLYKTLLNTHAAISDRRDKVLANRARLENAEKARRSGAGSSVSDSALVQSKEDILSIEQKHLIVPPQALLEVQNFFQMLSLVMRVDDAGNHVVFKNACPDGTKCRPLSFAFGDPTTSNANRLVEGMVASAAAMSPKVRGVRAVEIRNPLREQHEVEGGGTIQPFGHYQDMRDLMTLGYTRSGEQELIDAGMEPQLVKLFADYILEYQNINLLNPLVDAPEKEAMIVTVLNSIQFADGKEVLVMKTLMDMFSQIQQNSLRIDTLLESAQKFIRENDFNADSSPGLIRKALREALPGLLKPLMLKAFRDAGLADVSVEQLLSGLREGAGENRFSHLLKSKLAQYMFNKNKMTHLVGGEIPFIRYIAYMLPGDAEKKIAEMLEKVRRVNDSEQLDDGTTLSDEDLAKVIEIMKLVPKPDQIDAVFDFQSQMWSFINWYSLFISSWAFLLEIVVLVTLFSFRDPAVRLGKALKAMFSRAADMVEVNKPGRSI